MESIAEKILSLNSLKIGYVTGSKKNILLPPLSATANKGELISVIGRNGIGKSTLLRTLTGIQPSLGGEVFFSGKNIKDYSRIEIAQKAGYISTEIVKIGNMRIYDLVALGRFPHTNWIGKISANDNEIIMDAIEKTGMASLCNKMVSELSDGERQKAMIARILAQDTDLMIMDEPTAFLDIGSKYEILNLLSLLSHKNRKTIIFSTHDMNMAISQSDKIWLILNDRLAEGAPEDLMIDGAFNHLFESASVLFNSSDGTFSFRGEERGSLSVEGDDIYKFWTTEAVKRAGFTISEVKSNPFIRVISGKTITWHIISDNSMIDFESLYELIRWLRKEYPLSI